MPKLIAVIGGKHSGKTTIVENLIIELKLRGYRVAAVKEMVRIPTLDTPETETDRYNKAGAEIIIAVPRKETVLFIKKRLSINEILFYLKGLDYAILEGFESEKHIPKILAVENFYEFQKYINDSVVAISGKITESENKKQFVSTLTVPLLNSIRDRKKLATLVEQKALELAG